MKFAALKEKMLFPYRWFKQTTKRKKIITIVLLVIGLFTLIQIVKGSNSQPAYTTAKATIANITEIVSESGNITGASVVQVHSPATGIVEEMYVSNGDVVVAGQELFKVKSSATDQEKQSAYATYLAAKSSLNTAQSNANLLRSDMYANWKAFTDLSTASTYETDDGKAKEEERKAAEFQIAQDNWRSAEAKYNDQQTAIAQAQAQTNSTYLLYQATQNAVIKAPIAGRIVNLSVSDTGSVTAPALTATIPPVLSIANGTKTEVVIALSEVDSSKVLPGQRVVIDVNAVDDKTYNGTVARVDEIGTSNLGVIQYNAYVEVTNPDLKIKAGMTADVDITTKERSKVLTVPNASIKPYKGGRAVRVIDPKTKEVVFLPVEVGVKGEQKTEILKGITPGQEVIVSLSNDQLKRSGGLF